MYYGHIRGLIGSAFDHKSLLPGFESRRGHMSRMFHIDFGGRSAHLAYNVHKSGRKISIIITITYILQYE